MQIRRVVAERPLHASQKQASAEAPAKYPVPLGEVPPSTKTSLASSTPFSPVHALQKPTVDIQNFEEIASGNRNRRWTAIRGFRSRPYLVDRSNPENIVVKIYITLKGTPEEVAKVKAQEDQIEKHLQIPGFIVDVEWTTVRQVHELRTHAVTVKTEGWTLATSWNVNLHGHQVFAHEILHLLGLDDEYSWSVHANNQYMTPEERAQWVERSRTQRLPSDGAQGIMGNSALKVLRRHVNEIARRRTRAPAQIVATP